jgi:hypothetical protein
VSVRCIARIQGDWVRLCTPRGGLWGSPWWSYGQARSRRTSSQTAACI